MDADATSWSVIHGAARGEAAARQAFANRYLTLMRAYFLARWRHPLLRDRLEDAVQEAFVECFRSGGVLERVEPSRQGGFRPFLMGMLRNVARRVEERTNVAKARQAGTTDDPDIVSDDESLATALDREWALALVRMARDVHRARAAAAGEEALRRVELLRLRFEEGLPIREIAARWSADAARLHDEYAKARKEFRRALDEVVAEHVHGTHDDASRESARLLELLA